MNIEDKKKQADLLSKSLHERDLFIFKKSWEGGELKYMQVDVRELRESDVVFFRHPDNLGILLGEKGGRFFIVDSTPFCKNGLFMLDVREIQDTIPDEPVNKGELVSNTVIGKTYLRLV